MESAATHSRGPATEPDDGPVVEAYKKDVDRTLLQENLKLTPEQRVHRLMAFMRFLGETSNDWLRRSRRSIPTSGAQHPDCRSGSTPPPFAAV